MAIGEYDETPFVSRGRKGQGPALKITLFMQHDPIDWTTRHSNVYDTNKKNKDTLW